MKNLRTIAAVGILLCLAGCSASMVNPPGGGNSRYAPVNELDRPGLVRYLNQGATSVRERRRENAYKQMAEACRGEYRIDAEGPRTEGGMVMQVDPETAISTPTQYWYIQFSCVR